MTYFIIEHPTRGLVRDVEWPDHEPGFVARFTRADMRSDERVKRYVSVRQAQDDLDRLRDAGSPVVADLVILRAPDWEVV